MSNGMMGVCLMGETPGYFIDAEASKAVLTVLQKLINVDLTLQNLKNGLKKPEKMISKAQQMEREMSERMNIVQGEEDLRYIG